MLGQMEIAERMQNRTRQDSEQSLCDVFGCAFCALLLVLFGLTMLYSTTSATVGEKLFQKQLFWAVAALVGMAGIVLIGYRRLGRREVSFCLMLVVLVLLAIALCSHPVKGARRWIFLPGFQIQPSEIAKVVLPLYVAGLFADQWRALADWRRWKSLLLPGMLALAVPAMVMLGHDLGTTMLLAAGIVIAAFVGGIQKRFCVIPILGLVGIFLLVALFSPVRLARIKIFLDPENPAYSEEIGYQLLNSLYALGSGNWYGIGFGESRMKLNYLPESHTDFILAIVGEELGFAGLLAVVAGYVLFGWFGMRIALRAKSRFGMLLAFTLTSLIVLQGAINIGVIAGGLPTKGISAPFISYGGSNLVMTMAMVGLLLSIGLENAFGWTGWRSRQEGGE